MMGQPFIDTDGLWHVSVMHRQGCPAIDFEASA
jgi:hypothetical protein